MITPKSQLVANINNEIIDNGDGLISPNDVRHNLIDIIDSVHLLTEQYNLNALNFATPDTRTTRAGQKTLEKLSLDGYFSTDNSAFGYAALRSNYQGIKNTAIGSQALSCNIYGESNTALGYNALAGNTTGYGNIGIGNNTLTNNKIGHFNIAIGHSAGYYVTRDTNYKLFIASHPVESDYICANPLGSGLTPLVFGDLNASNLKFGIAVKSLHNAGTLQVSGGISPHLSSTDDLGHSSYRFKRLYLSNSLEFPSGKSVSYSYDNGSLIANNHIIPSVNAIYDIGTSGYQWRNGHFYDIYSSGLGQFKDVIITNDVLVSGNASKIIFNSDYYNKTIYLGSQTGVLSEVDSSFSGVSLSQNVGSDISINSNGTIIAFTSGTPNQPNVTGHANVYQIQNNTWQKLGNTFNDSFGASGARVALNNNGNLLSILNPYEEKIKVYEWNGSSWSQYGNDILTSIQAGNNDAIFKFQFNGDGNVLAIPYYSSGICKIYKYDSSTWSQLGNTIIPSSVDAGGLWAIAINDDANKLALSYLRTSPLESGIIKIYDYNSSTNIWNNSATISGGFQPFVNIDLSNDGNRLAVGDYGYNDSRGRVFVYEYNGNSWNKIGSTLEGLSTNSYYGASVSLNNDGTLLSVGGDKHQLLKWNNSSNNWNLLQTFIDDNDQNGDGQNKITKNGNRIIYSNPNFNLSRGIVKVFNYENIQGYASDDNMDYAGIVVQTSGINYFRNYEFVFRPKSYNTISSLESNTDYAKSSWNSNISFNIADGSHLKTQRVVSSGKLSLLTDPSGYGLIINREHTYLSRENIVPPLGNPASGDIAGLGQVNFVQSTGNCSDFNFTIGAMESGVNISQKFLNGIKRRTKDNLNNNKDKLSGFELKYYDDLNIGYVGGLSDRFAIRSFDYSSDSVNNLLLMKNDPNGGVFGINNFTTGGDTLFPKTIFNIRSKDNAVARITAENVSSGVHSALQLLGGSNCLQDGFETIYYHDSGIVDLNLYQDSGKLNIYRFTPYQAALFSSGISNATLTMGCSGFPYAAISLKDNTFTTGGITATSGYGKIYNVKVAREGSNQSHALYFIDGSGYTHDLTSNPYDVTGNSLYTESYTSPNTYGGNTYAGFNSPKTRVLFSQVRLGNTSYGTEALHHLASGDRNVAIGFRAGSGINNGTNNTIIGAFAGTTITSGNNNIVIGTSALLNASGYISNNIIIGDGVGTNFKDNYKFLLGYDSLILISGSLGPNHSNKVLALPTSGLLEINSYDNFDKLKLNHDSLEIFNQAGTYPQHNLTFKFSTPSGTSNLLTLNNSVAPSGSGNYACSGLPYAELNGNLKLLNNICFSDGTTLKSSSFLTTLSTVQSGVNSHETRLNSLFVEGMANENINPPLNSNVATTGTIRTKISNWADGPNVTIKNRDTLLKINQGDYVVAIYINGEYRPIWVSTEVLVCNNCNP